MFLNNNIFLNSDKIKKFRKLNKKKGNLDFFKRKRRLEHKKKKILRLNLRLKKKGLKKKRFIFKKLVNFLNKCGKKVKAYNLVLNILILLKLSTKKSPFFLIFLCIKKLKPYVKVVKVRKAGKVYEVPVPLNKKKQLFFILQWLLKSSNNRSGYSFEKKFVLEIIDTCYEKGNALIYKKEFIKKAYQNRAITHFRWF